MMAAFLHAVCVHLQPSSEDPERAVASFQGLRISFNYIQIQPEIQTIVVLLRVLLRN